MEDQLGNPKLMILDDNATNVLLLERMLMKNNYTNIKSLTDSRLAVETYRDYQPDLLLLDLRMPYLDGFDVLNQLNEIKGGDYLPVIVITAEDNRSNLLKALELGAKDFIQKPFDPYEIMIRIRNMLEMRLLQKQIHTQNKVLESKVIERTADLENMQLELFNRLLRATEFRDFDTGKHITRIGHYVYEMAKLIGKSETEAKELLYASMMHDIGKVGIPDQILLKAEPLTKAEFDTMKMHTSKGSQILAGNSIPVIRLAESIALTHHEKWDGSGYPNGLVGEQIPIEGRITALFDVFDALLSNRPYKRPWTFVDAVNQIKKESGRSFDPALTALFLKNIDTFQRIFEYYQEKRTEAVLSAQ